LLVQDAQGNATTCIATVTIRDDIGACQDSISIDLAALQLYPNPTGSVFHLLLPGDKPLRNVTLSLFNALGQPMGTRWIPFLDENVAIDVSDYVPGIYGVRVNTKDDSKRFKLIVLH
jgi:hypothetical protein